MCSRKNTNKKITRHIPLKVAAWNVRTLLDREDTDRPARCTALIAREVSIDIAVLSEIRLAGEGTLCERGAGYMFFLSGRQPGER